MLGVNGFPFPPASSSALSQEYDWHATSKAAVAGGVPGWSARRSGLGVLIAQHLGKEDVNSLKRA